MGALIQRFLGGGPLLQLDHVECCNDEVRSPSSTDSWRTHASGHAETEREDEVGTTAPNLPRGPRADIPWASPAASLAGR